MVCASGAFGLAMTAQTMFLVPLRARDLGASFEAIGLLVGMGGAASALLGPTMGAIVDRLGPKRAFLLGALASFVAAIALGTAAGYWPLLAAHAASRLVMQLGWVASQAYITTYGSGDDRSTLTGRFSLFSNIGEMAGPVLVGVVAGVVGLQWAFAVPAVYAAAFAILMALLPETTTAGDRDDHVAQGTGFRAAGALLANRGMRLVLAVTFGRLWITVVYTTFLPILMVESGIATARVGLVMALSGLVAAFVAPFTGRIANRTALNSIAGMALAGGGVALLLAPHLATTPGVVVVPALVGIMRGLSLPILLSIIANSVHRRQRGVALGLRTMANQGAATMAPWIVGPLIGALGLVMGFTAAGAVTIGLAGLAALQRLTATTEPPHHDPTDPT